MKKFLVIALLAAGLSAAAQDAKLTVSPNKNNQVISRQIYGHFAEHLGRCIYDGFWVNKGSKIPNDGRIRLDIVNALKQIRIPNLRWPGGCFADEYHWRDGIGPVAQRPHMVNTNWGGVTEDNSFGTHEFMKLCQLLGCEPYIAGNVGSGTVEEMAKWVEYFNAPGGSMADLRKANGHADPWKVTFWGVGNESWGCGGNMTAQFYTDQYKRYATYARNFPGAPLKKIASGANGDDYNWIETCMKNIGTQMWGVTLHYYTLPSGSWRGSKGSATKFDEKEYFNTVRNTLRMEEIITRNEATMDKYDPNKRVALVVDEWGVWTDVEPGTNPGFLFQQNSLRDALIAGINLNIFNNHSARVKMACLAQSVNVLQALVLTEKEKMLLTPTYHVFDLYQVHHDAKYLPIQLKTPDYGNGSEKIPALSVSASQDSTGAIHISLVNVDPNHAIPLQTALEGLNWNSVTGRMITSANITDVNTFDRPSNIHIVPFTGARKEGANLVAEIPAKSVVMLELK